MTANDNFSVHEGGQDGVGVTPLGGTTAPAKIQGNFTGFDNGSDTMQYQVAGTTPARK